MIIKLHCCTVFVENVKYSLKASLAKANANLRTWPILDIFTALKKIGVGFT